MSINGSPKSKEENLQKYILPTIQSHTELAIVGDGIDDKKSADFFACKFFFVGKTEDRPFVGVSDSYTLFQIRDYFISTHN